MTTRCENDICCWRGKKSETERRRGCGFSCNVAGGLFHLRQWCWDVSTHQHLQTRCWAPPQSFWFSGSGESQMTLMLLAGNQASTTLDPSYLRAEIKLSIVLIHKWDLWTLSKCCQLKWYPLGDQNAWENQNDWLQSHHVCFIFTSRGRRSHVNHCS